MDTAQKGILTGPRLSAGEAARGLPIHLFFIHSSLSRHTLSCVSSLDPKGQNEVRVSALLQPSVSGSEEGHCDTYYFPETEQMLALGSAHTLWSVEPE